MKVVFIIPCFNAESNLGILVDSILEQKDERWSCILIDDLSEDKTSDKIDLVVKSDDRFESIINTEKKYALRNIVESARRFQNDDDVIIAVIDGDDSLCNSDTVSILIDAYLEGADVVWTGHKWDINGINISREMPKSVNPYFWPWCSSHLRTFRSSMISGIHDDNFKNVFGEWFKRGYDQALMLPILYLTKNRRYIDKICYLYNIDSSSIPVGQREWSEMEQISTINIVRARGFIDKKLYSYRKE